MDDHGECRSVRLAAVDGPACATTLLHPFDRIDLLPAVRTPRRANRRRAARACAAAVRASHDAGETRTLLDARVRLLPYQVEPALAVLHGQATRVLLADEVGLGKTIQAGLILSELRARQLLRRGLILAPAGLREQWAAELRERFALEVSVMDAGAVSVLQRSLPPWVNPWTLPGVALASIDLLKRDVLLPQLEHVTWDAVVVDEAHHARRGTDRHALAALACSRARIVVLITATPHNGDRAAFDDLCALGALDDGQGPPLRIFRRRRVDVQASTTARRTRILNVRRSPIERRVDAALRSYTGRVWREGGADARLAMIVLRKRALSGPASLARSLARRLQGLAEGQPVDEGTQLSLDFSDSLGGELTDDDREPAGELAAAGLADRPTERQMLMDLLNHARHAVAHDSKGDRLIAALRSAREPAIVFTEYRDTLDDLRRRLQGHVQVALLHGAMMPHERRHAIAAFESGDARVLLATDAAAEGLNLQRRCRWIVHYEVPWSPVRIEQRNGRVDRIGQSRRVHVWHLVAPGTEEETVLARVAARSFAAARDLGDEASVAAAVFGDARIALPRSERSRHPPSRGAVLEAQRVDLLRRLPGTLRREVRPVCAASCRGCRSLITVYSAAVFDAHARQVSCCVVGVRAGALANGERAAKHLLGQTARASVAVHRAFRHAIRERERAIRAALAGAAATPVQPSLFDRRLIAVAEHRQAALERALGELDPDRGGSRDCTVRISLVGTLPG